MEVVRLAVADPDPQLWLAQQVLVRAEGQTRPGLGVGIGVPPLAASRSPSVTCAIMRARRACLISSRRNGLYASRNRGQNKLGSVRPL